MMKDKYKVLITSCWVLLALCFAIKILGGNWFEIAVSNETFINVCNYIDSKIWLKYFITTIFYSISSYIIYLAITKQKIGKDKYILIILLPASICKNYITLLGWFIDILVWMILPLLKYKFKNWLRVIIGVILIFVFQLISLLTKNIGIYIETTNILIGTILIIDYYIMLVLYYLYSNKMEVK